jgi:ferrochelatase
MARTGVLLTAFGGPGDLGEVESFMRSITGVDPTDEMLTETRRKYLTIGGFSPLPAMAERIAAQLERSLNDLERGVAEDDDGGTLGMWSGSMASVRTQEEVRIPVEVGMLHSEPSIASSVARLVDRGVRQIVHVSLSPFEAAATTGAYREAIENALQSHPGIRLVESAFYHRSDGFVSLYADNLSEALHDVDILANKAMVVFTAHSLPVADVEADPSYVAQLRETAAAVAAGAGLGDPSGFDAVEGIDAFGGPGVTAPWLLAFQSKGRRGGEWIGPDLGEVIDAAIEAGYAAVVVCPIGFAVDHMETLYDLDVAVADRLLSADREFARVPAPNGDARMIEALASAVQKVL